MLEVLGIKNVAKLIPIEEDQKPKDPVSENMALLNGKPIKAFLYQDHEAHIMVHLNAMQDPKMQQIIGQNPQAQTMQAALQAHVAEHVAFQYRIEIEKMLGVPLPPPDEPLPEDVEVELSRVIAAASAKLLQKDQAEAQQQQAQQAQQDPLVQMQQQELAIKQGELQRKIVKDQTDAQLREQDISLKDSRERDRIRAMEEIAGVQVGAKIAGEKASVASREEIEGLRIGAQIGSTRIPKEGA
jgi:hypothetical protein